MFIHGVLIQAKSQYRGEQGNGDAGSDIVSKVFDIATFRPEIEILFEK